MSTKVYVNHLELLTNLYKAVESVKRVPSDLYVAQYKRNCLLADFKHTYNLKCWTIKLTDRTYDTSIRYALHQ